MPDSKGIGHLITAGEANYSAKLTETEVEDIRFLWEQHKHLPCRRRKELGITVPALAEKYGVNRGTISRIINRRNWIHNGVPNILI